MQELNAAAKAYTGKRKDFQNRADAIKAIRTKVSAAHEKNMEWYRGKPGGRASGDGEASGPSGDVWGPVGGFDGSIMTDW